MNKLITEFSRYLLASGVGLTIDVSLLLAVTEWGGLHYLVGATLGFALGAVVVYLLSVNWVFGHRRITNRRTELTMFIGIGLAGLAINDIILWGLTDNVGLHYMHSKLLATGGVFLLNYVLRKTLLFSPPATLHVVLND